MNSTKSRPTTNSPESKAPAIQLLEDRVLVEPLEAEEMTPGGIVLPDVAKAKPQRGRVLAIGPGLLLEEFNTRKHLTVAVGDDVLFARFAGNDVTLGGTDYKIMRESDILAVVGAG